jgi:hypothetical protein
MRLVSRLTYANITSTLALVLALGVGTSYAADKALPKNSVGSAQIQTSAVKSVDIKNGGVTSLDVKDGALKTADLSAGALAELRAPRAYGVITSTGSLVPARSRNVSTFRVGVGDFCVIPVSGSGIDPTRTTIIATADYSDGSGGDHTVQVFQATQAAQPTDCPGGFNLLTRDNGTPTDIAFTFVIP